MRGKTKQQRNGPLSTENFEEAPKGFAMVILLMIAAFDDKKRRDGDNF